MIHVLWMHSLMPFQLCSHCRMVVSLVPPRQRKMVHRSVQYILLVHLNVHKAFLGKTTLKHACNSTQGICWQPGLLCCAHASQSQNDLVLQMGSAVSVPQCAFSNFSFRLNQAQRSLSTGSYMSLRSQEQNRPSCSGLSRRWNSCFNWDFCVLFLKCCGFWFVALMVLLAPVWNEYGCLFANVLW